MDTKPVKKRWQRGPELAIRIIAEGDGGRVLVDVPPAVAFDLLGDMQKMIVVDELRKAADDLDATIDPSIDRKYARSNRPPVIDEFPEADAPEPVPPAVAGQSESGPEIPGPETETKPAEPETPAVDPETKPVDLETVAENTTQLSDDLVVIESKGPTSKTEMRH